MLLTDTALADVIAEIDLSMQPAHLVQTMAEKSVGAIISFTASSTPGVNRERLRQLLGN
jgi:hypothetical protein